MILAQKVSTSKVAYSPARSIKPLKIACSNKFEENLNNMVEKKKNILKKRVDHVKEIGHSLEHIAKKEVKESMEIVKDIFPFINDIDFKEVKGFIKAQRKGRKSPLATRDNDSNANEVESKDEK